MVRDAEAHAADDKLKKDRIEASNQVCMLLSKNGYFLARHTKFRVASLCLEQ